MKPLLKTMISNEELSGRIARGKTLAEISKEILDRAGVLYSTAAISKRCAVIGLKLPRSGPRSGSLHTGWKGGRLLNKDGYYEIYSPDHPRRRKHTPYVLEHRLAMEKHLGRLLLPNEVIHHKNGDKTDNRLENLELFASNAAHLGETLKGRIPNWSEDGKRRMIAADRKKKPTTYLYSPEERQRRQARSIVASTIQSRLKLGALPSRKTIDDYLAQHGKDYQWAFETAFRRERLLFD